MSPIATIRRFGVLWHGYAVDPDLRISTWSFSERRAHDRAVRRWNAIMIGPW